MNIESLHSLTPIQSKFLNDSEHRFILVTAGRRSRKSLIAKRKAYGRGLANSNHVYKFGAPTYNQAKQIFWQDMVNFYQSINNISSVKIDKISLSDLTLSLTNGTRFEVVGLDKAYRSEGSPCDGWIITEIGNCKESVWQENIRPTLSDTLGFGILEGVPEGRNYVFDMVLEVCNGRLPKTEQQYGAFAEKEQWAWYSWFSSDVLLASEMIEVKSKLDERVFKQEYEGEFVEFGSCVYYAYSNLNYSDIEFNSTSDTYLCFDFNVNPMTCLINQRIDNDKYCFVKEFSLDNGNTTLTCEVVIDYLETNKFNGTLFLTGDYSGKSAHSSSSFSDWLIIENYFKNFKGNSGRPHPDIMPTKNIRNRVNALNSLFKSMTGEVRQFVNKEQCPILDKSLLYLQFTGRGNEFDVSKGKDYSHSPDAASYFAYNYYPIASGRRLQIL